MWVWWFSWKKNWCLSFHRLSTKGPQAKRNGKPGDKNDCESDRKKHKITFYKHFFVSDSWHVLRKTERSSGGGLLYFYDEALKSTGFGKYWLYSTKWHRSTYFPLLVPLRSLHTSFLFKASVFYHAIFNVMIYVFDKNWELISIK